MTSPSAQDGRPRLRVLVLRHQLTADARHSRHQGRGAVRPPERAIQPPDERDAVLLREAREEWALHLLPFGADSDARQLRSQMAKIVAEQAGADMLLIPLGGDARQFGL